MTSRSIKDASKTLQNLFSASKVPPSLPPEARRMLQAFIDETDGNGRASEQDANDANSQIRSLWDKFVSGHPSKLGAFAGVLKELRPALIGRKDVFDWWQMVLRPVITSNSQKKVVYEDAHDFLVGIMVYEEDDADAAIRASISERLARDLFNLYIARSRIIDAVARDTDVADNLQIAQRAESILIAFGKKHPKEFCTGIDDLLQAPVTRVQALTLLGSFLKHQTPHLYTIINTPLIGSLLKCLMNDTSTTVISIATNTLIMILPHVPGSLTPYLPRLFLIYSRLLCWEKFSPLSTEAQKSLVTDDRVATATHTNGDPRDIGIDADWEKVVPMPGAVESTTPEVKTYFTFLYGLYPLNFMSYIRRPRKYLKTVNFPGADEFDLDQAVIRARTDQFREIHRLHPNFYHFTMSDELEDPKWIKTDPSDVVAECHALVIRATSSVSPGPPPSRKLPDLPNLPPLGNGTPVESGRTSPTHSLASFRSGQNWRVPTIAEPTSAIALESPMSRPATSASNDDRSSFLPTNGQLPSLDEFPLPASATSKPRDSPENNVQHLQRQITLLTNELNFEKWHKAQYSQHISQLARKNVKEATAEAETLNLINANRALKQQIEQIRNAREASVKDSALARKQAGSLENHMMEKFRTMKKEQEGWLNESAELRRLREEITQYRDLLVACEARELSKTHELEILQRDIDQVHSLKEQLKESNKRNREYEYRDFEFERSKRETEILQREKETLQMKLQRREQESDRSQRAFKDRIAELEARANATDSYGVRSPTQATSESRMYMHQMESEANVKLAQLKKAYNRLLERHTDLELECQALKTRLTRLQGGTELRSPPGTGMTESSFDFNGIGSDGMSSIVRGGDSAYDSYGEYNAQLEPPFSTASASDPIGRRYGAAIAAAAPSESVTSRAATMSSRNSTQLVMYNQTAPLDDSASVRSPRSENSGDTAKDKKAANKIQPSSEIRVYGRGGAQNIKLKTKDKEKKDDKPKSGFRSFRNIM